MILTIQQWKEILNAVKSSENGVLDAIKEELKRQDQDTYQKWKQKGSDINHLFSVSINNHTQARELTLLHIAAFNGQLEIVKYLVDEKNVDVNQKCDCFTPLHFAAWHGHKDVVTTLLEKGADIANVVNSSLWTPLHLAAWHGHKDVVTTLLGKGANVNAADHGLWTPLHLAAEYGHIDAMNALLAAEADVDLQNRDGKTPLRLAVEKERKSAAELLIAHKIKLQGFNPQKPEYLAQHNSHFTREMSEYWDRCLGEYEKLEKEDKLLHDFLKESDTSTLVSIWEQNPDVRNKFDNQESLKRQYPEYAGILINKANEVKKGIFLHNHKPLIDALSTHYGRDLQAMTL